MRHQVLLPVFVNLDCMFVRLGGHFSNVQGINGTIWPRGERSEFKSCSMRSAFLQQCRKYCAVDLLGALNMVTFPVNSLHQQLLWPQRGVGSRFCHRHIKHCPKDTKPAEGSSILQSQHLCSSVELLQLRLIKNLGLRRLIRV